MNSVWGRVRGIWRLGKGDLCEELHGCELKGLSPNSETWIMILRLRRKILDREMPYASRSPDI